MKGALAMLLVAAMAGSAAAQDVKIGYVDVQRALNESEAGAKAKEEFKRELDKLQAELKKQRDRIETLKDQIEKKAAVLKDQERRNLEKDYQKRLRDFERAYKDSQGELQAKDNELTASILRDLQEIIQEIGDREGYLLVFEASANVLLYGAKSADLTDRVIEEYNRTGSKKR